MTDGARGGSADRDLRTGTPIWHRRGVPRIATLPLEADLVVDVAVVGAGVTGALVTDALLRAGKTVAVLDRRGPALGSTAASTALLQFEIDQPLVHLAEALGEARAVRAWWRSAAAVDALRGRIADLGLRCGFKERRTVYLPGDVLGVRGLAAEAALRERVGLRSRFIGPDELRALTGIEDRGAILSAGAGELDPVALVSGVWRSAGARGARLFAPVEVTGIAAGRKRVTLATDSGHEVEATHAVLATGYELMAMVEVEGYKISTTWAMATAPQPARLWPDRCLIWQAADPYLYMRTTADGRVIVGGEDEPYADAATRDAALPKKIATIAKKLGRLMPGLDTTPAFAWTGCFGESATGLPAIGPVPGAPRCLAVLGYGGNGITFSTVAAQLVQRHVLGLEDPDADLFALPR